VEADLENSSELGRKFRVSAGMIGTERKPKTGWRRGWDSNPRDPFGPNGFQDRRSQPLSYPSCKLSLLASGHGSNYEGKNWGGACLHAHSGLAFLPENAGQRSWFGPPLLRSPPESSPLGCPRVMYGRANRSKPLLYSFRLFRVN
jgi:hypothetical protein